VNICEPCQPKSAVSQHADYDNGSMQAKRRFTKLFVKLPIHLSVI